MHHPLTAVSSCSFDVPLSCQTSRCQFIMCFKIKFPANPFKSLIYRSCYRPTRYSHIVCNFLMGLSKNKLLMDEVTLFICQNSQPCQIYLHQPGAFVPRVQNLHDGKCTRLFDQPAHAALPPCHCSRRQRAGCLQCQRFYQLHQFFENFP